MNFIEKILDAFNKFFSFLGNVFGKLFQFLADLFKPLFDILVKPLTLLFDLLEGIFYFLFQLWNVIVLVVKIGVASFQFVGALLTGVWRTITQWTSVNVTPSSKFVSSTEQGFGVLIEQLQPTGLLTVLPMIALAFLWFFFVIKMIGLFGGEINVKPFGGSK